MGFRLFFLSCVYRDSIHGTISYGIYSFLDISHCITGKACDMVRISKKESGGLYERENSEKI